MLSFIGHRGEVVDLGVATMWLVPALDVPEDLLTCAGLGAEGTPPEPFALEAGKETLAHRVVKAVPDRDDLEAQSSMRPPRS